MVNQQIILTTYMICLEYKRSCKKYTVGGRDSSVGKSSAYLAGDPGSNPSGGLTPKACMRGEDITTCKSYIASVNLTDFCIMICL